jgi:hypothetical protein
MRSQDTTAQIKRYARKGILFMHNPHYEPSEANGEAEPSIWELTHEQLDARSQRKDGIDYGLRQPSSGGHKKTKLEGEVTAKDSPVLWKRKRRKLVTVSLTKAELIAKCVVRLAHPEGAVGGVRAGLCGCLPYGHK